MSTSAASRIDATRPHSARIWDYWLGGKDNYEVDRELGEKVLGTFPDVKVMAGAMRAFMHRSVDHLAREGGIRQFLDIGTGMPTEPNVHQIVQRTAADARVVYVDNDPAVLAHARALLTPQPPAVCAYVDTDLREPGKLLARAAETLDLSQPVGITLLSILHFIHDDVDVRLIVDRLLAAVPSGSYLAITHATTDFGGPSIRRAMDTWNQTVVTPIHPRSRERLDELFFTGRGLELVEPGIVSPPEWHPAAGETATRDQCPNYGAVARKP